MSKEKELVSHGTQYIYIFEHKSEKGLLQCG